MSPIFKVSDKVSQRCDTHEVVERTVPKFCPLEEICCCWTLRANNIAEILLDNFKQRRNQQDYRKCSDIAHREAAKERFGNSVKAKK